MKFSLKAVALSAVIASTVLAAPVVEKRDVNSDRIAACFVGLLFTGSWPGSCKAAISVDLGLIRSIAINQMTMDFTTANPWAPTMSSNDVVATMLSIPGITLPIDSVRQHVIIIDNGVQLGAFDTPWSAASVKGGTMKTAFTTSTLNIFPDAKNAFSSFVGSLSTKDSHSVTLKGSVDAKLSLGVFGHLTVPGIGFKASVPIKGLGGLKNQKYIYAIEVYPGLTDSKTYMTSILNINNPSQLTVALGDVNFNSTYKGAHIGISTVKALKLVPGDNQVLTYTILDTSLSAAQEFSTALTERSEVMGISGYANSSTNPALNAGLKAVSSGVTIPQGFQGLSMSQHPYKDWSIKISPTRVATVTATFQSPYYGYPYELVYPNTDYVNEVYCGQGVADATDRSIWKFQKNVKAKVSGTGTTTVTFEVTIAKKLNPILVKAYNDMINYAKSHGGTIPIKIELLPIIIVNGDGVERFVDWSTTGNKLGDVNLKIGDDFANILIQ
ncbi:hypothetical protein BGZ96_002512 [Linnemannia gamsii]|uniref:Uncharacterized protein n=1 Tax=Linnemannia gamsii TaxID=64522 RepID=A0ABQ7K7Y0_9FUNG|nr:hypothetical protein BGZ96_002512 [Linnemannia gamsii]